MNLKIKCFLPCPVRRKVKFAPKLYLRNAIYFFERYFCDIPDYSNFQIEGFV